MLLTVLGKYGPYPTSNGACSSYLVSEGNTSILLDIGSGAFSRLSAHMDYTRLNAVFLSHYHYDHCSDLGVLQYALQGKRTEQLCVYSPCHEGSYYIEHPLKHCEIHDGLSVQVGELKITFFEVKHPLKSYACCITNSKGSTLFYTGDTRNTDNLFELARDCDLLLADTGLLKPVTALPVQPHLTAEEVGVLARKSGAKRLICTHIHPQVDEKDILELVDFENKCIAVEGVTYEV